MRQLEAALASLPGGRRLLDQAGGVRHVDPLTLGSLYEATLSEERRRVTGTHYTPSEVLERVLEPTLERPWQHRIDQAATRGALRTLHRELCALQILDPAAGCGAFLVASLRALARLERLLRSRLGEDRAPPRVGASQLAGLDTDHAALAVARVAIALTSLQEGLDTSLSADLRCEDALAVPWPRAEIILGNPPFLAKNKLQRALGRPAVEALRARHPEVPGHADYCTYWFRLAHLHLPEGGRAGLVGTNTVRQTSSRRGALDLIARTGTIVEAVPDLAWPGEAGVRVAIVSWVKGPHPGHARLRERVRGQWRVRELPRLGASLVSAVDVDAARPLEVNQSPKLCFQGLTHGHAGLLLSPEQARELLTEHPECKDHVRPYLTAADLLKSQGAAASRWIIDLHPLPLERVPEVLRRRLEHTVLPARRQAAQREAERNRRAARGTRHHARFLERWWWPSWPRPELKERLAGLSRVLVGPRYARTPVLAFVDPSWRPSDVVQVFALEDDYSLGILQSSAHRAWFEARCSTLLDTPRYTSTTVWDSFPWPRSTPDQARAIAAAAQGVLEARAALGRPLKELYDAPPSSLQGAHELLDAAVLAAYGLHPDEVLEGLLALNLSGDSPAPGPMC